MLQRLIYSASVVVVLADNCSCFSFLFLSTSITLLLLDYPKKYPKITRKAFPNICIEALRSKYAATHKQGDNDQ